MAIPPEFDTPNRRKFAADPFGYSSLAWLKWGLVQGIAGFSVDPTSPPESSDLKSPVLWLSHARALSEAATTVLRSEPKFEQMPIELKDICDSQYCAVGLMLVGFSLEVSLKGMLIVRNGVEAYEKEESKYRHHRLESLADFVPGINEKDRAILRGLTRFVIWAGRYPDPGAGREGHADAIFDESEQYEICGSELFELASRVMAHASKVVEEQE